MKLIALICFKGDGPYKFKILKKGDDNSLILRRDYMIMKPLIKHKFKFI